MNYYNYYWYYSGLRTWIIVDQKSLIITYYYLVLHKHILHKIISIVYSIDTRSCIMKKCIYSIVC